MAQVSPALAAARLQKWKEEIALRKQQRKEKQQLQVQQSRDETQQEFEDEHAADVVPPKQNRFEMTTKTRKSKNLKTQFHGSEKEIETLTHGPRKKDKREKVVSDADAIPMEKTETETENVPRKLKKAKRQKILDSNSNTLDSESAKPRSCKSVDSDGRNESSNAEPNNCVDNLNDDGDDRKTTAECPESNHCEEEDMEAEDSNIIGGFSVLGNFDSEVAKPVKRELPHWLAHPTIIKDGRGLKRKLNVEKDGGTDKLEDADLKIFNILDADLINKLQEQGINSFFPVQKAFIPELWKDLKFTMFGGRYGFRPRDICVSAPTGSGKTLAYVLPIIQTLKTRMVPHICVVTVLPVRDLAEQVYSVFSQYSAVKKLKVGLAVGKTTFKVEQDTLVRFSCGKYHSLVDILVATPGRLIDHVKSTPGFDLSHLRFLVVDEADRMMEVRSDWLDEVETAAYTTNPDAYFPYSRKRPSPYLTVANAHCTEMPLQKLLFSATLSHNPEKLERMKLFMPRLMTSVVASTPSVSAKVHSGQQQEDDELNQTDDVQESTGEGFIGKYTTPEGLTEYIVESSVSEKPLVILHFLHSLKFRNVLCFTNSVESTHRLCLLVKLFGDLKVREFSSRLPGERRKKILKQFSKGKIDLLVCSDAMARGMDVDNVKYVISYDKPPYIKTYIHRVGRTARAGRAGTAISLLEKKEFFHFKKMMRDAGKWSKVKEMKIGRQALRPLEQPFQEALAQLSLVVKKEKKRPK